MISPDARRDASRHDDWPVSYRTHACVMWMMTYGGGDDVVVVVVVVVVVTSVSMSRDKNRLYLVEQQSVTQSRKSVINMLELGGCTRPRQSGKQQR